MRGRLLNKSSPRAHWLVVVICGLAALGFYPTYFRLAPGFTGTAAVVHFHVVTLGLWLLLSIAQPVLARRGRIDLHRRLGAVSYVLVPLAFVGFVLMVDYGQTRSKNPALVLASLFDGAMFLVFYALGIAYRKRPAYHARFMVLASLPFINPALGRLISPKVSLPIQLLVIVALLGHELRVRRAARRADAETRGASPRPSPGQPWPYAVGLAYFVTSFAALITVMVALPSVPERLWQLFWA